MKTENDPAWSLIEMLDKAYPVDEYIYAVVDADSIATFFENVCDAFDFKNAKYLEGGVYSSVVRLPIKRTTKEQQHMDRIRLDADGKFKADEYDFLIDKKIDGSVKLKPVKRRPSVIDALGGISVFVCIGIVIAGIIADIFYLLKG